MMGRISMSIKRSGIIFKRVFQNLDNFTSQILQDIQMIIKRLVWRVIYSEIRMNCSSFQAFRGHMVEMI